MVLFFPTISSQHCNKIHCEEEDSIGTIKNCTYWDPAQFNEESPSILYGKNLRNVFAIAVSIISIILELSF